MRIQWRRGTYCLGQCLPSVKHGLIAIALGFYVMSVSCIVVLCSESGKTLGTIKPWQRRAKSPTVRKLKGTWYKTLLWRTSPSCEDKHTNWRNCKEVKLPYTQAEISHHVSCTCLSCNEHLWLSASHTAALSSLMVMEIILDGRWEIRDSFLSGSYHLLLSQLQRNQNFLFNHLP